MAKTIFLKITRIEQETSQARSLYLQPQHGEELKYLAGQFLTFLFKVRGKEIRRSYSLSSSPDADQELRITVKWVENGSISQYLAQAATEGEVLEALAPAGLFSIDTQPTGRRDIFLVAGGSGITPVYSLLKSLLVKEPQSRVTLIYSNHNESQAIFYHKLMELRRQYPEQLEIEFLFSNHRFVLKGRLSATSLELLLKKHLHFAREQALIYTCGPFGLMQTVQIVALSNGFSKNNIRREIFTIDAETASPDLYFDRKDRNIILQYLGNTHLILVPYNVTILNAALSQGIDLPYSCKAGRCSACRAKIVAGNLWMHYNEVLTQKDEDAGWVLTCTGHPASEEVQLVV